MVLAQNIYLESTSEEQDATIPYLDEPIDLKEFTKPHLGKSIRDFLEYIGITSYGDLLKIVKQDPKCFQHKRNFGYKSYCELINHLMEKGIELPPHKTPYN